MRPAGALVALAVALALSTTARAEPRPYRGPHPMDLDGHWHEEDEVHVHDDLPVGLEPFAEVDGVLVFLGDPDAYGWDGPTWTYDGMHPLPARIGDYCGIAGAHRHPFAPEGDYRRSDGVWRYVGALRGGVPLHRPGRLTPSEERVRRHATGRRLETEAPVVVPVVPPCGVFRETAGDVTTTFAWGWPHCVPIDAPSVVVRRPSSDCRPDRRCRPPVRVEEPAPVRAEPPAGPRRPSPRGSLGRPEAVGRRVR